MRLLGWLAILWTMAILVAWFVAGAGLSWQTPIGSYMPEFPAEGLIALLLGLIAAFTQTLLGICIAEGMVSRKLSGPLQIAFGYLLGGAIVGIAAGWVGFYRLMPGLLPLVLVIAVLASRGWRLPKLNRQIGAVTPERVLGWAALLLIIFAAMAPAVESDGLRYHLVGPQEWLRAGRFVPIEWSANSNLPAMQGLLAAVAAGPYALYRTYQVIHALHAAALFAIVGWIAVALSRAVYITAYRHGSSIPNNLKGTRQYMGGLVPVLVISIPVVSIVAAWPFADVASLAYLMAAIAVLLPGFIPKVEARVLLAGWMMGAALATKLSALPQVGLIGLCMIPMMYRHATMGLFLRRMALVSVAALMVLGPWLLKSTMYHGNPVYPLAYGIFGGPEWSAENDIFYKEKAAEKGMGRTPTAAIMAPYNTTFHPERFESQQPGPSLLALLPLALGALVLLGRNRLRGAGRVLVIPALLLVGGAITWFFSYQSVRFLMPTQLMVLLLGVPVLLLLADRMGTHGVKVARVLLIVMALSGIIWSTNYRMNIVPVSQAAAGMIGKDVYIQARLNSYTALRWLDDATEPNEPVFSIGEHRAAYAQHWRMITSDWFDTPRVLVEIKQSSDNATLLASLRERGIRYVLINQAELGLYEEYYFKPRFTTEEWLRFESLRRELMQHIVFDSGNGIYVVRLPETKP